MAQTKEQPIQEEVAYHLNPTLTKKPCRGSLEMAAEWGKIPRLVLDLEKQGSKVSSLKWLRKRLKFWGIPRLVLEKAEEKGKIPRLVSSSEKF